MKFTEIELPSNRRFGVFFAIVFLTVGIYLFFIDLLIYSYSLIAISGISFLVALLRAELLLPLNKVWMRFGFLLGLIVGPIVLGVIFFGLFTPIALAMKLFGRDELRLRLGDRESHWKIKNKSSSEIHSFKNQF